jgi:ribosomal protein S18 acetylase RimI-like enzyme
VNLTLPAVDELPPGWTPRVPGAEDVRAITDLVAAHKRMVRGKASVDEETIAASVTGVGSWTRRQIVLDDQAGELVAWAHVHDRAAGRTMLDVIVAPDVPEADAVAAVLYRWVEATATQVALQRGLAETQLDALVYADDERQHRWLAEAGYEMTRTYLNMTRPVDDGESLPGPREGVRVRRVAKHDDALPVAQDLQIVHQMLEESFADHFNSYRESFPEFVQRLREDPGHRWDHWWIAEVEVDGEWAPGGALVSSVLPPDDDGRRGSYVDYIGVHRRARGRGVAKSLLHTVIRDARQRGRTSVDLEVDADSPTGADGLYRSMEWTTTYVTESWHATATPEEITQPRT